MKKEFNANDFQAEQEALERQIEANELFNRLCKEIGEDEAVKMFLNTILKKGGDPNGLRRLI